VKAAQQPYKSRIFFAAPRQFLPFDKFIAKKKSPLCIINHFAQLSAIPRGSMELHESNMIATWFRVMRKQTPTNESRQNASTMHLFSSLFAWLDHAIQLDFPYVGAHETE